MHKKTITFTILFILFEISIAKPTVLEMEDFVNYEIDIERSKELIDFLMIKKLKSLEVAYKQNNHKPQSFSDIFLKSSQTPVFDKNFVLALRKKSHTNNDSTLQFLLGVIYTGNFIDDEDFYYNIGLTYLTLSAEQNNLDSQRELCREYSIGINIPRSLFDEAKWCYIASENGNDEDKENLNKILKNTTDAFVSIYNNGVNAGKEWLSKHSKIKNDN